MVIELAACGLLIATVGYLHDDLEDDFGSGPVKGAIAIVAVEMALVALCLILDIVAIVKRSRRTLGPKEFLVYNVIQTTIWVVFIIMSFVGASSAGTIIVGIIIL